jgi:excinuclease ABC subunit A
MGPEGGVRGGMVVAEGTPEDVARVEASHTGGFLREILEVEAETKPARRSSRSKTAGTSRRGRGAA